MSADPPHPGEPPSPLRVLRAADRTASPWRNGGGVTREIARGPAESASGDFDWRLSIAEVTADGPFSTFAGVRRVIVLIAGAAMTLTVDGVDHALGLYQPLTFDGASATTCTLPAGPTRDLNLMTTIGRASGSIEVEQLVAGGGLMVGGGARLVLLALSGQLIATTAYGAEVALDPLDALCWSAPEPLALRGPGALAIVRIATN